MNNNQHAITEAIKQAGQIYVNCHINGTGGSFLPGKKAKEIYPDILKVTSNGVKTILISGTNGKTTTTKMLASMFQFVGIDCFYNKEGANTEEGITTAYVLNADIEGRPVKRLAVIECDELYIPKMFQVLNPEILILLPLSLDQPDRLGLPDNVAEVIKKSLIGRDVTLCINGDCAYLENIALSCTDKKRIIRYSYKNNKCKIDDKVYSVKLKLHAEYNYCNAAAAIAGVIAYKINPVSCINALKDMKMPFGRMESFCLNNHENIITLVKNAVSMRHTLEYLNSLQKTYKVVIGINESDYDGHDLTWSKDFPYRDYKNLLEDVLITGNKYEDMASAIIEAGINHRIIDDEQKIIDYVKNSEIPVFMILNYTCLMGIRKRLADNGIVYPFWEEPLPDVHNELSSI